jgi:hypothetical protein
MRAIAVIVVVLLVVGWIVHSKLAERDEIFDATSDFFWDYSQGDAGRKERLDVFRPCFGEAYELSFLLGEDRIDLARLVDCLNGNNPVFDLERIRDEDPPFPYR